MYHLGLDKLVPVPFPSWLFFSFHLSTTCAAFVHHCHPHRHPEIKSMPSSVDSGSLTIIMQTGSQSFTFHVNSPPSICIYPVLLVASTLLSCQTTSVVVQTHTITKMHRCH